MEQNNNSGCSNVVLGIAMLCGGIAAIIRCIMILFD